MALKLLFAVFIGGHAITFLFFDELWPFSSYPMYSEIFKEKVFVYYEFRKINSSNQEEEIEIKKEFWPFWERALVEAMDKHLRLGKEPQSLLKALLTWKNSTLIDTEKWQALRLYKTEYEWESVRKAGVQVTKTKQIPDRVKLFAEARQ